MKRQVLEDWAKEIGVDSATLHYRIQHWGIEKALTTPPIRKSKRHFEVDGIKGSLSDLARHFNIGLNTVRRRLKKGINLKEALITPV